MKKKKKKTRLKLWVKIVLVIFCLGLGSGLFLLYGPYRGFRDWLITTAMNTMSHQYLATWFYSTATIDDALSRHTIEEPKDNTNLNFDIEEEAIFYANEYEKEILEREKDASYKIIKISGKGYEGFLAVVYDASKIKLVTSKNLFSNGEYLVDMAKRENALLAINAGGFIDMDSYGNVGYGNGGTPVGIVIKDGEIIQSTSGGHSGVIGFTNDNKLYLGRVTAQEAIDLGVRDAVEFGPFLVVNGESAFINGNGGYGTHPRTAIGQRKDGIVLLLVIDGRRIGCLGATMNDLSEIMIRYGAYNAANLDGGNSSVLVENYKILNHPINWDNMEQTRKIATGFIVTK